MTEIENTSINKTKSQKIAMNTVILFIRMFVITIVNLYTVRLVLKGLGAEDYGIFNTVAGVVTTTSFISSILELSIQRFYSVALGKRSPEESSAIFSISLKMILILSFTIFVIFESGGLWFICNKLTIPAIRLDAAIYCFHFSLIAFLLSIVQIPFSSAIFAHEAMNAYAVISSIDCLLKLLVSVSIGLFMYDHLSYYSFGLMVVAFVTFMLYTTFAHKRYKECSYHRTKDKTLVKSLLSFSGWTMFGSIAKVGMIQGSTIILNIFFGPLANAAFAISLQINNAFNALSNSMVLAVRPAMIKAYTSQSNDYLYKLFNVSNKFLLYILLLIAIPMIGNMGTIIHLWLGEASKETILFAQLTIVYIIVLAMNNPITIIVQASGNIKNYFLYVESVSLMCVPISYIAFKLGYASYYIYITMILVCVVAHAIRLVCLKKQFNLFKYRDYIIGLCLPAIIISVIGILVEYSISQYVVNDYLHLLSSFIIGPIAICCAIYLIGINTAEREVLKKISCKILKH